MMPLPDVIPAKMYDLLKESLSGKKAESLFESGKEADLLDELVKIYDFAQAKEKVQLANQDLVKQRDSWSLSKKELEDKIKLFESEVEKLKQSQLSDEERQNYLKLKDKGMNADVEAKINALTSQIEGLQSAIKVEQEAKEAERKSATQARYEREIEQLKSDLMKKLADAKIEGNRADIAIDSILSKGMAKIEETEKGFARKIRLFDNGKELESNLDDMVVKFAQQHDYLVSGTKQGGTGQQHEKFVTSGKTIPFGQMLSTK
jgi:hypothetical protein